MSDAADGATSTDAASTDAGTETATTDRTFTQAELDRVVQDRLARERQKYDGFDDFKQKAAEFDKFQEAQKSELEKAQERAAKSESDAKAALELAKKATLNSALIAEAAKKGFNDPADAIRHLAETVEVDGDGTPTNIAEAVDSLLKAKPYLAGGGARGDADQGVRGGGANQLTREQLQKMSSAEIVKAQNEGRLDGVLGRS